MSLDNLPVEWQTTEIGQLIDDMFGGLSPKTTDYQVSGVLALNKGDIKQSGILKIKNSANYLSDNFIGSSIDKIVQKNDVLVTLRDLSQKADFLGLVALYKGSQKAVITQGMYKLLLNEVLDRRFLMWYSNSPLYRLQVKNEKVGATQVHLRNDQFKDLSIPLPPIAEQQEIVRQLDVMLAQVEQIKARLDAIPAILKKFRQSVLADAVSGKLTEDLGGTQEWIEKPLSEVASHVVDCPHSTPKWSENGKICVRTTAFNPFFLDLTEQGFVSQEVYDERIQRLKPEPKDVLYSREGTVGIACQIPVGVELCLGQRMVLIRAGKEIDDKFLTIILNSYKILEIVKSKTMGSTAPRVNMSDIRAYPIPLPSLDEQRVIVGKVEALFNSADNLDDLIKLAQKRVNLLTQSILAKAFSGELTADWRQQHQELITGVNSAEALLAKIQAEREASKPVKKTRVKKEV